jgi:hypothetical protein
MNKARENRDKFLKHIMKEFPFDGTEGTGVYYDEELKAVMAVTGNEVSFEFREGIRAQPGYFCISPQKGIFQKNIHSWPKGSERANSIFPRTALARR